MTRIGRRLWLVAWILAAAGSPAAAGPPDETLAAYFVEQTGGIASGSLGEIRTLADWQARRETFRDQLYEMLGLSPLPERTDLQPVITGTLEQDEFIVEKLHFQSLPGLYVTANLYRPKKAGAPAPAVLYVCGHARVVKEGVSYGNKTGYQHHGAWFARNGYVCLLIDTIQLGEIEGIHHGTYREGMWWWNSRGYTSTGVEAWNSIRALDYLVTRPEVDSTRIGVTGRSGGGAYSWWLAALDDRVKVAAPVAGITDLENHVIDGVVEGHCDCMFIVNTYRWDYDQVAALVAPRPLLIANSDKDSIFPLDGVVRLHAKVRRIYDLHRAADKLGLLITEGPHKDTQDLQLPVFRWFNRHLKNDDPLIEMAATRFFEPEQLKVFERLPSDARNRNIHHTFVPAAAVPPTPADPGAWRRQRDAWLEALEQKSFGAWPADPPPLRPVRRASASSEGRLFEVYEFDSQPPFRLRLYLLRPGDPRHARRLVLRVLNEAEWPGWLARFSRDFPDALVSERATAPAAAEEKDAAWEQPPSQEDAIQAFFAPRGIGPSAWNSDPKKRIQIRRRFMLLGQTLDGMRVWDIRRAIQALRSLADLKTAPLSLEARGEMAASALYASLFEPDLERLALWQLPRSHREGPDYLNVLRLLDLPAALAMALERSPVQLYQTEPSEWDYPRAVAERLGWPNKLGLEAAPPGTGR